MFLFLPYLKYTRDKDLIKFLTDVNSNPELTSSIKSLVLWNIIDKDDSRQVISPNFMTPDEFMSKQHGEIDHITAPISDQIETTPASLIELRTGFIILSLANNNPRSIHTGVPGDTQLSKIAESHNTVAKLQKIIADSPSPRKAVSESPKALQPVSVLLLQKFAKPRKMIAEYRKRPYSPRSTIAENSKSANNTGFANRPHTIAEVSSNFAPVRLAGS